MDTTQAEQDLIDTSSELLTGDRFLNLTILEGFLEKYPEDLTKWINHLKPPVEQANNVNYSEEMLNTFVIEHDSTQPSDEESCCVCKKSFSSTPSHVTITLLCNHKLHTICYLMDEYQYNLSCPSPGCTLNMWHIARKINDRVVNTKKKITNVFVDKCIERPEFKEDITVIKGIIRDIRECRNRLSGAKKQAMNTLMEKHKYSLQLIQDDINKIGVDIRKLDDFKKVKAYRLRFRRLERQMERKYNLTLHEMVKYKIIKVSWRIRCLLGRHSSINNLCYSRIRINTGVKKWV
jgi:hypothetical protein